MQRFIRLLFVSLLLGKAAYAQNDKICDPREYAAFVAYAQGLDPLADALGRKLLECSRQDYREAALFWMSFYLSMKGAKDKVLALKPAYSGSVTEKDRLQYSALMGEPTALAQRVQAGDDSFANDPWILLSLARGQMRAQQFTPAFQSYNQILAIRDGQEGIEVELLFAYIWAGDQNAARAKIASLRRFELSPYMRQSVDRAEALLGGAIAEAKPFPNLTPGALDPWITVGYLLQRDNRGYEEQGGLISYHGAVELEVEALQHKIPLEHAAETVAHVDVRKVWLGADKRVQRTVALGYFSPGKQHITAELSGRFAVPDGLMVGLGAKREAVALVARPPAHERAGLMRDSLFWDVGWGQLLDFRGQVSKEDSKSLFESYRLDIHLKHEPELENGFGVFIPLRYYHRPMPSPDYRTYPEEYRAGVGFRLNLTDGRRYLLRGDAILESVQRNDYAVLTKYDAMLGASLDIHARYYYRRGFYQFLQAAGSNLGKGSGEKDDEKRAEILLGVGLGEAGH